MTLFPSFFDSPLSISLLGRALSQGLVYIQAHDIRQFSADRHRMVDDTPYGGGPGMVMKPEPIVAALEAVTDKTKRTRRIYFSPQGRLLKQGFLKDYLQYDQLILLCGRYEGVDERVIEHFMDEEISIGDYLLTGGEFAAAVFVDAVTRLIPGVVGSEESLKQESLNPPSGMGGILEYPQYTRPENFRGFKVPDILLSGDHKRIELWRKDQSLLRTQKKRPDLL